MRLWTHRDKFGTALRSPFFNWERWFVLRRRKLLPQAAWGTANLSGGETWTLNRDKSVTIEAPATTGPNLRVWHRAAGATPWGVSVLLKPLLPAAADTQHAGIAFREDATGRMHTLSIQGDGNFHIGRYTSPTALSSEDVDTGIPAWDKGSVWLRIEDDGSTRNFYVSNDGWVWYLAFNLTRTTFLTADRYCIFVNEQSNGVPAIATFFSLRKSTTGK